MRTVFVDTNHWLAILNPRDDLHTKAVAVSESLGSTRYVTSEMVLAEVLNFLGTKGTHLRLAAR